MRWVVKEPLGFDAPKPRGVGMRWHAASLEVFAGLALVASTALVVTIVSIGIARADVLHPLAAGAGRLALLMAGG